MAVPSSQQPGHNLWSSRNVLRDGGLSYQDDVEQLPFLLFRKMSQEQEDLGSESNIPKRDAWPTLVKKSGTDLGLHYRLIL